MTIGRVAKHLWSINRMNILTLNSTITQLRCRVLTSGFQYEAMINNQWLPVTHKFAEIVWDNFRLKQRTLVKISPLSYINSALAKSSVGCGSLNQVADSYRCSLRFFYVRITPILSMVGRSDGVERLAGFYLTSLPTSLRLIAQFGSCSMRFNKLQVEAVIMTTIPNPGVSNRTISMSKIDIINKKLLQAEAILYLLTANSTAEIKINDNLVTNALWIASDLVAEARHSLHSNTRKEIDV